MKFFDKLASKAGYARIKNLYFAGAGFANGIWDWITAPASIDIDIRRDMLRLRSHARDLAINNPIVRQFLGLLAANVIGPRGIKMQSQIRDNSGKLNKALNDKVEAGWTDFWKSPFADGRMSGVQGEQLLIKTVATDGEAFVRMLKGFPNKFGFALQPIDADLVDHTFNRPRGNGQNEVRLGIEVDEYGRAVGIWAWDSYPSDINKSSRERVRLDAKDVIQLYDPERINQTRGVTWFNSVMVPLKMLHGYFEAELFAARLEATQTPMFKTSSPDAFDEKGGPINFEAKTGKGFQLPPGWEAQFWNPTHPGGNFPPFIKASLRIISCGWKVSYNALANDLEGVNYSSLRSGLLIERDNWRVLQRWWIDRFLQPVFESWLAMAMISGAVVLDSRDFRKFLNVKWCPRGWAWVDPLKDVQAAVIAVANGFSSRGMIVSEKGDDVEDIYEELHEEKQLAKDYDLDFGVQPLNPATVKKETEQIESDPKSPANRFRYLIKDEDDWTDEDWETERGRAREILDTHLAGV